MMTKDQYDAAIARLEELFSKPENTPDEDAEASWLGDLILEYDNFYFPLE